MYRHFRHGQKHSAVFSKDRQAFFSIRNGCLPSLFRFNKIPHINFLTSLLFRCLWPKIVPLISNCYLGWIDVIYQQAMAWAYLQPPRGFRTGGTKTGNLNQAKMCLLTTLSLADHRSERNGVVWL